MRMIGVLLLGLANCVGWGQFVVGNSGTAANLRGIDAVSAGVAWASGADGTVIRTVDGGAVWQTCAVPTGGSKLDFRAVQGFDAMTAVVMSSGKGALSKVYRTADGCKTWALVFTDPDAEGFFDAMRKVTGRQMYLLGDPVKGKFAMFYSADQGASWFETDDPGLEAEKGDGGFAASNSALTALAGTLYFGTGGGGQANVYGTYARCAEGAAKDAACPLAWRKVVVPMAAGSAGAGVFSLAARTTATSSGKLAGLVVAVGGDYEKADEKGGSAAWSKDDGLHWAAASGLPGGYRSAVAFDRSAQAWLAVGPNGADVSRDDGKSWTALTGETAAGWNAISLPFVVGPKGRVGRVMEGVLGK